MIDVVNRQRRIAVDRHRLADLAGSVCASVPGASPRRMTIALVGDRAIRRLNRTYRGLDRATDVLSFPAGLGPGEGGEFSYLGDVVISTQAVERQARAAGHSVEREMAELLIHGTLHLLGYDHEVDQGRMDRLERRLRRRLLD